MKLVRFELMGQSWALLPLSDFEELREQLEAAADEEAALDALDAKAETFPAAFVERLSLSCDSPVRLWREYRGMSATELACRAKVSTAQISAIENGASDGSVRTLRRIAEALDTDLDHIVQMFRDDDS